MGGCVRDESPKPVGATTCSAERALAFLHARHSIGKRCQRPTETTRQHSTRTIDAKNWFSEVSGPTLSVRPRPTLAE